MKTKMKMKNNRMLLALVMVAALAMVSVAGVAVISDESDAASTDLSGELNLPSGFNADIFVFGPSTITIEKGASYSGTISYGVRTGTGTPADPYLYAPAGSITLTNATDLVITANEFRMQVNGGYTGTIVLNAGTVEFGVTSTAQPGTAFNGTVKASDATVAMSNVKGVRISYMDGVSIWGDVTSDDPKTGATVFGTISVSGTANIGYSEASGVKGLSIPANVKMIIADGANVTVGGSNLYSVSVSLTGDILTAITTNFTAANEPITCTIDGMTLTQAQVDQVFNLQAASISMLLSAGDHVIEFTNSAAAPYTLTMKIVKVGDAAVANMIVTATGGTTAQAPITGAGANATYNVATTQTLTLATGSELEVKGNLGVMKTDDNLAGSIAGAGKISVAGAITAGDALIASLNVNAAWYKTGAGTTTSPTIYNYTNLANAMTKSADVHIRGTLVISSDMTLTGTSATKNTITLDTGAKLKIGVAAEPTNNILAASATVTVPATTTLTITGEITVVNGKLITQAKIIDFGSAKISADVMMKVAKDGVYTDLATALGMAKSGDVLTLRNAMTITTSMTLADGITLKALAANTLTIGENGVLTINGTLEAATVAVSGQSTAGANAGILNLNSNNVKITSLTIGSAGNGGTLNIGAADLKMTTIATGAANVTSPVLINITGKFTGAIGANASNVLITVSGVFEGSIVAGTVANMDVSGRFVCTVDSSINNLTVAGNGKVSENKEKVLTVSGVLSIGDVTKDIKENINKATVTVSGLTGTAYIYGTYDVKNIVLAGTGSAATATFYFGKVLYATAFGADAAVVAPSATFTNYLFKGWFSDENLTTQVAVNDVKAKAAGVSYYGLAVGKAFSVTYTFNAGLTAWIVNGVGTTSSTQTLHYGDVVTVGVSVADGYEGTPSITVNGKAYASGSEYTITGDTVFNVSGITEKKASDSMEITEILLIILVVIIALLAIIVVFKMLRS